MILSIAWKNIWRNKLRSLVVITGITLGIFAGVFSWAFYAGMVDQRIATAINTETAHIQIHNKNFLEDPDIKNIISDYNLIDNKLQKYSAISAYAPRIIVNAMIMSAETGAGIKIIGIIPEKEINVTDIHKKLIEGKYFESGKNNQILIGDKLAEKLNVKTGSKVVIAGQQYDGTLTKAHFKVIGIYKTANSVFNESNVFIRESDLRKVLALDDATYHEIAIKLKSNDLLELQLEKIRSEFNNLDIKSWKELMPDVSLVEESVNISMIVFMIIILIGLIFTIINTMLMAVFERVKEIGMLMAIGMNHFKIVLMIMYETILLIMLGGIAGIVLACIVVKLTSYTGINLSAWGDVYASLGYETIVFPVFNLTILVQTTIMILLAGLIASIYPALKALQLKPAEALRIDV